MAYAEKNTALCGCSGVHLFAGNGIRVLMPRAQAGGDRALVVEARGHLDRAKRVKAKLGEDAALAGRLEGAEAAVTAAEAWAKACEECEAAVRRGREALTAGNRDEATAHCRTARGLIDGGLRSEALRTAVQELEGLLQSAAEVEGARAAGGECFAAAQAALLAGDGATARAQHAAAAGHFARAGAGEMRAALDALAAHIDAMDGRRATDEGRRRGDGLLEKASALIKAGDLLAARAAVDGARAAYEAAGVAGVAGGLDRIEEQLRDAEERVRVRQEGDAALQEAVDCAGRAEFAVARAAVARARAAYERAGAAAMQAAVEEIEAAIAEAEAEVEAAAAAAAEAEADAEEAESDGLWRKAEDPETGDVYYYHTETKATAWDRPRGYDSDADERLLAEEHAARAAEVAGEEGAEGAPPPPPGQGVPGALLLGGNVGVAEDERTLGELDARVRAGRFVFFWGVLAIVKDHGVSDGNHADDVDSKREAHDATKRWWRSTLCRDNRVIDADRGHASDFSATISTSAAAVLTAPWRRASVLK